LLPSFGAMTAATGGDLSGGEGMVVAFLAVGQWERWFSGRSHLSSEKRRATLFPIRDAPISCNRRHEGWGSGARAKAILWIQTTQRQVIFRLSFRGAITVNKIKVQFLRFLRDRSDGNRVGRRRRSWSTAKTGMTGPVQHGDDLLELSNGEVRDFSAVKLVALSSLVRECKDQVLHALEPSWCSFLYSHLIFHLWIPN